MKVRLILCRVILSLMIVMGVQLIQLGRDIRVLGDITRVLYVESEILEGNVLALQKATSGLISNSEPKKLTLSEEDVIKEVLEKVFGGDFIIVPGEYSNVPLTKEWHDAIEKTYNIGGNDSYQLVIREDDRLILVIER